jgi:hypothetical protein
VSAAELVRSRDFVLRVRCLAYEAGVAGDLVQAALCRLALRGSRAAALRCADALLAAEAWS